MSLLCRSNCTRPTFNEAFSRSLIVYVWVSADETTSIHFVKLVKVNDRYYRELLVVSCQNLTCFNKTERSPIGHARQLIWWRGRLQTFFPCFDFQTTPVDYEVWSVMQIYKWRMKNVYELCSLILAARDELDQRVIDAAVRQWCVRLHACDNVRQTFWTQSGPVVFIVAFDYNSIVYQTFLPNSHFFVHLFKKPYNKKQVVP